MYQEDIVVFVHVDEMFDTECQWSIVRYIAES